LGNGGAHQFCFLPPPPSAREKEKKKGGKRKPKKGEKRGEEEVGVFRSKILALSCPASEGRKGKGRESFP